jgi:hypothetical protein
LYFNSRTTADLASSDYTHRGKRQQTHHLQTQQQPTANSQQSLWYLANGNVGKVSRENDVVPMATHQAMAQGGGHFLRRQRKQEAQSGEGQEEGSIHDIDFGLKEGSEEEYPTGGVGRRHSEREDERDDLSGELPQPTPFCDSGRK